MSDKKDWYAEYLKAKHGNVIRDKRIDALEEQQRNDMLLIEACHSAILSMKERLAKYEGKTKEETK